ncbi:hypothetical protein ABE65_013055 [Fictibacillus phosphorivorans]|uniref:Amidohydrolase-related domain-containing protein n=1 Tax=Fictibacillus phosphorivorans TaxID=1221500 RepID=A0A160INA2_9BACL|nr:hypothetical protein [Fictibacillus phosphorivorans]ANC77674.1 hypothetical protein ABE65_013055 [Fictibacillus phosphorivorans]
MRYIIERPLQSLGTDTVLSYLVDSQKISYVSQGPLRMNVMKMSMQGVKMIPGHISPLMSLNRLPIEMVRQNLSERVRSGTTTLLTSAEINYLHEAETELKRTRHLLISSSIDYCIGLSMSPEKITPQMMSFCRKQKIPFIQLNCKDFAQLTHVIWERISEANFSYGTVIFPTFPSSIDQKLKNTWHKKWNELSIKRQIPTLFHDLCESEPISLPSLKMLGLYPVKGGLFTGSDADYCIYRTDGLRDALQTVIVRGRIVFTNHDREQHQGYGKEIIVVKPRRFGESLVSRV